MRLFVQIVVTGLVVLVALAALAAWFHVSAGTRETRTDREVLKAHCDRLMEENFKLRRELEALRQSETAATPPVPADDAPPVPAPAAETQPEPAKPDEAEFGKIKVNLREKCIEVTGRFCLEEGILDYLGVMTGGQEYESVIALDCKGSLLHAGLLALGAVPGPTQQLIEALKKDPPKDRKIPEHAGTPLDITFEWEKDGKILRSSASLTVVNRKTGKAQHAGRWIFTGSYFAKDPEDDKEYYMADIDRALIGVLDTPSAVINFSHDAGNPYEAEDAGYEVNKTLVPPKNTPVKLIITLAKPPAKE